MPDFTPGPWKSILYDLGEPEVYTHNLLVVAPDGEVVADPRCGPDRTNEEIKANSDLIAAAPDLYNALTRMLAADEITTTGNEWDDARENARYTLMKARGEP